MPFTDEELKRLKGSKTLSISHDGLLGLIARLEAAEAVCQVCDDHEYNPCPGVTEGLKAWRKAAGK